MGLKVAELPILKISENKFVLFIRVCSSTFISTSQKLRPLEEVEHFPKMQFSNGHFLRDSLRILGEIVKVRRCEKFQKWPFAKVYSRKYFNSFHEKKSKNK